MIERHNFVSNSSSTSFIIENKTQESLELLEFVLENFFLWDVYPIVEHDAEVLIKKVDVGDGN